MKIASRIRRTVAVMAAAAAVATVALPAASADASIGSMTANLRVYPVEGVPGYSWVHIYGRVSMTQSEAQYLINTRHNVVIRLWGEDPASDDLLLGPDNAPDDALSGGLYYSVAYKLPNSRLNEDWGEDDLYAGVRLVQPNSVTLRSAESNRVWGYF
jgi:hypothetical protein